MTLTLHFIHLTIQAAKMNPTFTFSKRLLMHVIVTLTLSAQIPLEYILVRFTLMFHEFKYSKVIARAVRAI